MHLLHDIFEGDEVFDVEVGLEREVLGGGIEVDVEAWAFDDAEMFDEGEAEGCLGLYMSVWRLLSREIPGESHTLPAPAGPMTKVPNLLMFLDVLHQPITYARDT